VSLYRLEPVSTNLCHPARNLAALICHDANYTDVTRKLKRTAPSW